ncbi:hypothetical protein KVR01_003819 [Diaporthe batatas]|uniref:uncharacterized protein n=1 Tax=Diaporthe batatas TaxID=748121 RepID=UPI001D048B3F|nr:uncharacterized protein KVR01_003819 [Diaporthe batatas]KAG8168130.1 hypothetical protein KVR01_003819 [Diaporthe batatas]
MAVISRSVKGRHCLATSRKVIGSVAATHIFHAMVRVRRLPRLSVALKRPDTLGDQLVNKKLADSLTRITHRKNSSHGMDVDKSGFCGQAVGSAVDNERHVAKIHTNVDMAMDIDTDNDMGIEADLIDLMDVDDVDTDMSDDDDFSHCPSTPSTPATIYSATWTPSPKFQAPSTPPSTYSQAFFKTPETSGSSFWQTIADTPTPANNLPAAASPTPVRNGPIGFTMEPPAAQQPAAQQPVRNGPISFNMEPLKPQPAAAQQPATQQPVRNGPISFNMEPLKPQAATAQQAATLQGMRNGPIAFTMESPKPQPPAPQQPVRNGPITFTVGPFTPQKAAAQQQFNTQQGPTHPQQPTAQQAMRNGPIAFTMEPFTPKQAAAQQQFPTQQFATQQFATQQFTTQQGPVHPQQPAAQQPVRNGPIAFTMGPFTPQQPAAQQPHAQQPHTQQPHAQQPDTQQPHAQQPFTQPAVKNGPIAFTMEPQQSTTQPAPAKPSPTVAPLAPRTHQLPPHRAIKPLEPQAMDHLTHGLASFHVSDPATYDWTLAPRFGPYVGRANSEAFETKLAFLADQPMECLVQRMTGTSFHVTKAKDQNWTAPTIYGPFVGKENSAAWEAKWESWWDAFRAAEAKLDSDEVPHVDKGKGVATEPQPAGEDEGATSPAPSSPPAQATSAAVPAAYDYAFANNMMDHMYYSALPRLAVEFNSRDKPWYTSARRENEADDLKEKMDRKELNGESFAMIDGAYRDRSSLDRMSLCELFDDWWTDVISDDLYMIFRDWSEDDHVKFGNELRDAFSAYIDSPPPPAETADDDSD